MIEAIKNGDAFAYEQAYLQYCEKVYCYFRKKVKNDEDAQDLMQTTFLKLWKYRRSLSTDYLLEQHLFHIARTVFIDHLRKENKRIYLQQQLNLQFKENSTAYIPSEPDLLSQLSTVLSTMPETRKKVFELNRLYGYSYKEIAELLSISVKSVDNNLSKAMRQIKKLLFILIFILMKL